MLIQSRTLYRDAILTAMYKIIMAVQIVDVNAVRVWLEVSQQHWKLCIGVGVLLVPLITYIVTIFISRIGRADRRHGREPPLNPYWFPFLGNWWSFLLARESFLNKIQ